MWTLFEFKFALRDRKWKGRDGQHKTVGSWLSYGEVRERRSKR
jgi:hypothetical protein